MNTLRRIPRHMVKALAAGAVLIAAALPLAVASTAGAATVPVVNFVANGLGTSIGTAVITGGAPGTTTLQLGDATVGAATNLAGYGLYDVNTGTFLTTVTSGIISGSSGVGRTRSSFRQLSVRLLRLTRS